MKKLLAIMLSAFMVLGLCAFTASAETATEIGSWSELVAWAASDDATSDVKLTADITAEGTWSPKALFSGTFDGAGHSITGLTGAQGLITKIDGATIKSLSIVDAVITADASAVGAFAGKTDGDSSIIDCYTNAKITGSVNNYGGFVGDGTYNGTGTLTFEGCWFDGEVIASGTEGNNGRYVSGFLANNESTPVVFKNCLCTGIAESCNNPVISQFAGAVYNGTITCENCLAAGTVKVPEGKFDTYAGAYTWRAYAARGTAEVKDAYTNCYAIEGSAAFLDGEKDANKTSDPGKVEWIAASDVTVEKLGAGWGDKNGQVVPKAFATPSNYVTIATWDELVAWAADASDNADMTFALIADIAAPAEATWTAKAAFAGTFDGAGYSISGLKSTGASNLGFINALSGTVKNLFIIDAEFNGSNQCNGGVIAVGEEGAVVENVYSDAKITGVNHCGGIIATLTGNVTVTSCWFDGEITVSGRYAAGIVGNQQSKDAVITDCLNTGRISGNKNIAGISDAVYSGKLDATRCVNAGLVTASGADAAAIADTVGENNKSLGAYAKFVDCFAVKDMQGVLGVRDLRTTNTDAYVDGDVTEVETLAALKDVAALQSNWSVNPNGLAVPTYFADKDLGPIAADIIINNWEELVDWAADASDNAGQSVALAADISAPTDAVWAPKAEFAGTFNGYGFTISGLKAEGDGSAFITNLKGRLCNLYIVDSTFGSAESSCCAAAAAWLDDGAEVENVYSNATIIGVNHCGGIASNLMPGTAYITSCWFDGEVTVSGMYASGILGNHQFNHAVITDCLNTGKVTAEGGNASGISTAVYKGSLVATRCVNLGAIAMKDAALGCAICKTLTEDADNNLVGEATLTDCYNLKGAAVSQPDDVRGNSKVNGEVIEVESLDDLSAFYGLGTAWAVLSHNDQDIVVPVYFAGADGEAIPEPVAPSEPTGEVPGSSGEVPGSSGEVPGSSGEVPGSSGEVPGSSDEVPGSSNEAPASVSADASGSDSTATPSASSAPTTADGITVFMIVALVLSAGAFVVVSKARARG